VLDFFACFVFLWVVLGFRTVVSAVNTGLLFCRFYTVLYICTLHTLLVANKDNIQQETLARLRAGQRDGRRRRQVDDDFGGWVKTTVLFLAVSVSKFMKFWDDVGDPS